MRGYALLALAAGVLLTTSGAARPSEIADQRRRLIEARRAASEATIRAERLSAQAGAERDAAARAQAHERALAGRIVAAEAELNAAAARAALVEDLLTRRRANLAAAQAPAARLLAALQSLARRPPIVAIVQPGSVDDLVHVRAVLGTALPTVRARTAGLRAEIDNTRRLRTAALTAAAALRDSRAKLASARVTLAQAEAAHRARAQALGRGALGESDRALAMGERARDMVDRMAETGAADATATGLARLDGPLPRPLAPGATAPPRVRGAYRLPVAGRLVTGLDEISDAGIRSRGLTFAVAAGAAVSAPAAGTIRYARPFRRYGTIVILDHGAGWTSLVTGLGTATVAAGDRVGAGTTIGRAANREDPRITVELRRRGRPVDAAALVG
ncbi:murein hydrolase activator EnvC family protein [Sphingomonas sp.]|jgi:murein DD-endopeptidase MepM/ murein hydrolase activator NlpD|uniref:murein hydrolase activator EnvC family protein n=1 Tax=Sphingomonas sp. TaxID=28214 RepID=UPI002EDAEE87